jgi:hypothetical protein
VGASAVALTARRPFGQPAARGHVAPAAAIARRAGHGVAVLLKIYAHCIEGQADAANRRITDALGAQDPEPEPSDEENGDSEQAS